MTGGVDDGDIKLGGLEFPKSNVNGDSTLTLSLQFVENPSVLERTLSNIKLGLRDKRKDQKFHGQHVLDNSLKRNCPFQM